MTAAHPTTATVTIKFFARLREQLATDELTLPIPPGGTVADLIHTLAARGTPWDELAGDQPVMIAVNRTMARASSPLTAGDEVALFPPVTGG